MAISHGAIMAGSDELIVNRNKGVRSV